MESRRTIPVRTRWRGRLLAGVVLAVVGVGTLATTAMADPSPSTITDYATYPADLPDGCPEGPGALEGVSFSNGRDGEAGDLRALDVRHGDTVTMSWTGFADGCTEADGSPAITVSLAAYATSAPQFDPDADGPLLPGAQSCGADAGSCGSDGDYSLSITLPTAPEACNLQLDAVLGLPLGMIGPNGSFYGKWLRGGSGPDMLVSASNFGLEPCEEAPTTTTSTTTTVPEEEGTTTTTSTTTTVPEEEGTTTTTETTTTVPEEEGTTTTETTTGTGTAPTTDESPPSTELAGSNVSPVSVPPVVLSSGEEAGPSPKAQGTQVLPTTGASQTGDYVRLGMLLAGAGAIIATTSGLWHRRRQTV